MALEVMIRKQLGAFRLDVQFCTQDRPLALLGASGSGKSMTLKCIAGIERPDEGRIVLNGRTLFDSARHIDLPPQKRRVGYLFQQYALFPNMTAAQNILTGLHACPRGERQARLQEQLRTFRLEQAAQLRPRQLSGGQQQRTALARILASEPEALLLDEPFSALDSSLRWQLELELLDMLDTFRGEVLFVSHSRDEVSRLCRSVCVLTDGRSEPVTTVPELMAAPRTLSGAQISGCKNISACTHTGGHSVFCADWGVSLACAEQARPEHRFAGVRAHAWRISALPAEGAFPCRAVRVLDNVFSAIVMLSTPAGSSGPHLLRAELPKEAWAALADAETLYLTCPPEQVLLLTGGGEP